MREEPIIFEKQDGQELRINMISPWLKNHFAEMQATDPQDPDGRTLKVVKLSIDGGFTCPNRDGSKGSGGCLFCSESGSGEMASKAEICTDSEYVIDGTDIRNAMQRQIELLSDKWPEDRYKLKFIRYFQSHTNTYGPIEKIRAFLETTIDFPGIVGLAVATRRDCISDEVLKLLQEINKKTFLWVELGLQTIHEDTAKRMNLCHEKDDYDEALRRLSEKDIRVVTHLILGLPGETEEMMMESVRHVSRPIAEDGSHIFGMKLHMLNVVKGSGMEKEYPEYVSFESMDKYIDLLIKALEIIPSDITMHRISGDVPRSILIAPKWSYQKRTVLNSIHKEMKKRNTWQGRLASRESDISKSREL
ncbi:MAG: TIGR01212 family radical SAM protein [Eubacteriales bacterium]|nr:TIGR01212 family radical SAM protein [Eubacteriales bacterium]